MYAWIDVIFPLLHPQGVNLFASLWIGLLVIGAVLAVRALRMRQCEPAATRIEWLAARMRELTPETLSREYEALCEELISSPEWGLLWRKFDGQFSHGGGRLAARKPVHVRRFFDEETLVNPFVDRRLAGVLPWALLGLGGIGSLIGLALQIDRGEGMPGGAIGALSTFLWGILVAAFVAVIERRQGEELRKRLAALQEMIDGLFVGIAVEGPVRGGVETAESVDGGDLEPALAELRAAVASFEEKLEGRESGESVDLANRLEGFDDRLSRIESVLSGLDGTVSGLVAESAESGDAASGIADRLERLEGGVGRTAEGLSELRAELIAALQSPSRGGGGDDREPPEQLIEGLQRLQERLDSLEETDGDALIESLQAAMNGQYQALRAAIEERKPVESTKDSGPALADLGERSNRTSAEMAEALGARLDADLGALREDLMVEFRELREGGRSSDLSLDVKVQLARLEEELQQANGAIGGLGDRLVEARRSEAEGLIEKLHSLLAEVNGVRAALDPGEREETAKKVRRIEERIGQLGDELEEVSSALQAVEKGMDSRHRQLEGGMRRGVEELQADVEQVAHALGRLREERGDLPEEMMGRLERIEGSLSAIREAMREEGDRSASRQKQLEVGLRGRVEALQESFTAVSRGQREGQTAIDEKLQRFERLQQQSESQRDRLREELGEMNEHLSAALEKVDVEQRESREVLQECLADLSERVNGLLEGLQEGQRELMRRVEEGSAALAQEIGRGFDGQNERFAASADSLREAFAQEIASSKGGMAESLEDIKRQFEVVGEGVGRQLSNMGALLYRPEGKGEQLEEMYRWRIEAQEKLRVREPENAELADELARSWQGLAALLLKGERRNQAEAGYRRSIEIWEERDPGRSAPLLAESLFRVGRLCEESGRTEEAETSYRRAVESWEQVWNGAERERGIGFSLVEALEDLGRLCEEGYRLGDAEICFTRGLEVQEELVGESGDVEDGAKLARMAARIGRLCIEGGQAEKGEEHYRCATEVLEALYARRPDEVAVAGELAESLRRLSEVIDAGERKDEAEEHYRRATEVLEALYARRPDEVAVAGELAESLRRLGRLCEEGGRGTEAEGYYLRAVEIWEEMQAADAGDPEPGRRAAYGLRRLGERCEREGRLSEAGGYYRREAVMWEGLRGRVPEGESIDGELGRALRRIGSVCEQEGHVQEAEEQYRRAVEVWERMHGRDPLDDRLADDLATLLIDLGSLHLQGERLEEAVDVCRRGIEIWEEIYRKNSEDSGTKWKLVDIYHDLGFLLADTGDKKGAFTMISRYIDLEDRESEAAAVAEGRSILESLE